MLVFFYFFSLKQKKDYTYSLLYQDTIIRISLLSMFYYYTIITLLLLRTNLHTIKPIFSFAFSFCTFSYIPIVNHPYLPINLFTHHHYRGGSFNLSQYCFAVHSLHKKKADASHLPLSSFTLPFSLPLRTFFLNPIISKVINIQHFSSFKNSYSR